MSSMNADSMTCPECGTENSTQNLFCAECGASLSRAFSAQRETEATMATDGITQPFTPAPNTSYQATPTSYHASPPAYQDTTSTMTDQYAVQPPPQAPRQDYPVYDDRPAPGYVPHQESIRGMILGWIATLLILAIIAFFAWSTLIDQSMRDRITGIFG